MFSGAVLTKEGLLPLQPFIPRIIPQLTSIMVLHLFEMQTVIYS